MGDEVVGLVLKVGGLRVVGAEVFGGGGYVGMWWERCVEDVCGFGRWGGGGCCCCRVLGLVFC